MGASPGAVLAFLIAGPATNAATLTTIWRVLGRRTAGLYLLTIAASAIACGLVLDGLLPERAVGGLASAGHDHGQTEGGAGRVVAAITLLGVLAWSYASKRSARKKPPGTVVADAEAGLRRMDLGISGMTCSHCAESVRRALTECPGVQTAEVDLSDGRATVRGQGFGRETLLSAVAELGYVPQVVGNGPPEPEAADPDGSGTKK
jgi:copper chaperone CopZ